MARALPRATPPQVRAQLARFGLDADRAETPVANLSGGEKARLLLALATREAPQLLILDEPTNHLDIDAREALVKALADFQGAVLLITHDPHLVELVADRLWLVADGTVRPFDGDLDDYRALLAERARPPAKADAGTAPRRPRANAPRRAPPWRRCAGRRRTPRRGSPNWPRSAPRSRRSWPIRRCMPPDATAEIDRRQHAAGRDLTRGGGRGSGLAGGRRSAGSRVVVFIVIASGCRPGGRPATG